MGNEEIWRDIPGYEGYYQASSQGRIKSIARVVIVAPSKQAPHGYRRPVRERLLKQSLDRDKRPVVTLWRAHEQLRAHVHSLVALAFLGATPDGMYVCHENGDSGDNRYLNLYHGTPTQNARDKRRHGTHLEGEDIPFAKLSEEDVRAIIANPHGLSQEALATCFGVAQSQISRIINRKEWRHLHREAA